METGSHAIRSVMEMMTVGTTAMRANLRAVVSLDIHYIYTFASYSS